VTVVARRGYSRRIRAGRWQPVDPGL